MSSTKGYAALTAKAPLQPYSFDRREPREHDVVIEIKYCGICHSDIHQARDEWGEAIFPMVPGHEIAGTVTAVVASPWGWGSSRAEPVPSANRFR